MHIIFRSLAVLSSIAAVAPTAMAAPPNLQKPPQTMLVQQLKALAKRAPIVVAHRGDSSTAPENTVPAFEAAHEAGADMIELDVHQTADGVLVCNHDYTLDRTTDAETVLGKKKQRVDALPFKALEKLDAGAWKHKKFSGTRMPTLATALDVIQRDAIAMIEHKAGDPERYVEVLRSKDLLDDVLLQSFDWEFLRRVHALEPRITIGALGPNDEAKTLSPAVFEAVKSTGASMIHWKAKDLRVEDVATLRSRGYLSCCYTLDDDIALVGGAAMGLDAVTTNKPARLRLLVAEGHATR